MRIRSVSTFPLNLQNLRKKRFSAGSGVDKNPRNKLKALTARSVVHITPFETEQDI